MNQMTNIAIVGATGVVGKAMLEVLEARNFPLNQLFLLASERSENQSFLYKKEKITVQSLDAFDFNQVQIALFAIGSELTKRYVPEAVKAGCVVIDNSSTYRYDPNVPLVIPEVNADCIADYVHQNIIANPNCSTIQMLVALKPIHDAVGIKRINVATYQSVSGSGKQAISELITQLGQLLNGKPAKSEVYAQQIAFNVLPHIDEFLENNYTREEMKM
ncbi:MAG TPA: aspartate-semialdehyde dehydrogenase, partial [Legionellales bacterium]|nr:aspartate-semialdehyde dehydrogenase [Legionellales bacterium]